MSKTLQEITPFQENSENDFHDMKDLNSFEKQTRRHEASMSKTFKESLICEESAENDFQHKKDITSFDRRTRRYEGHVKENIPLLPTGNSQQHEKQCVTVNSSSRDMQIIPTQPSSKRPTTADKPNANTVFSHSSNDRPNTLMTSKFSLERDTLTGSSTKIDFDTELGGAEKKREQKKCVSVCSRSKCYLVLALVFSILLCMPLYVIYFNSKFDISGGVHGDGFNAEQIKTAEFSPRKHSMNEFATNITWCQLYQDKSFVQLDNTGQLIIVREKGTYSIFVSLAVDDRNCKTNDTKSLICLRYENTNEKCAKAQIAKNTAFSVPIRLDIFLGIGELLWVTGLGFDCADELKSYMTIIKF